MENKVAAPVVVPESYGSKLLNQVTGLVQPIAERYQQMAAVDQAAQLTPEQAAVLEQQSLQTGVPVGQLEALARQQNLQAVAPETGTGQPMPASEPSAVISENSLNSEDHFTARPQAAVSQASAAPKQNPIEQQFNASFNRQKAATTAVAEAQALKFEAEAQQRSLYEQEAKQKEVDYLAQQKVLQERTDSEIAKLQSVQDRISNFEFKDYWADKSGGQKAMAAIAIALGGIGAAYQGGGAQNRGLAVINETIDRDLKLQQLQFNKLKESGDVSKSLIGIMNQQFGNQQQAMTAARMFMNDRMANKISEITSKYSAPEVRERGLMAVEDLTQKNLVLKQQFEQQAKQQALIDGVQNLAGNDITRLSTSQVQQLDSVYKGFAERYVPGYGEAINAEQAREFQKYRAEVEPGIAGARRILNLTKDFNRVTDLSKRAEMATEVQALVGQLRLPFLGPGAMTEQEYERLKDTLGNPAKLAALPALERIKINTVMNKLQLDLKMRAKNAGLAVPQDAEYFKKMK